MTKRITSFVLLAAVALCFVACEIFNPAVYSIILDAEEDLKSTGTISIVNGKPDLNTFLPVNEIAGKCEVEGFYVKVNSKPVKVLNPDGSFASSSIPGFVKDGKWIYEDNCVLYAVCVRYYPLGGQIFYKAATTSISAGNVTADGAVYSFYDKDGKKITNLSALNNEAGIVSGFDAYSYSVLNKGEKDIFYVAYTKDGQISLYPDNTEGLEYQWGNFNSDTFKDHSLWGNASTDSPIWAIGKGREVTQMCLDSDVEWEDGSQLEEPLKPSIFYVLQNNVNVEDGANGCNDWYVPSLYELIEMEKTLPNPFADNLTAVFSCNEFSLETALGISANYRGSHGGYKKDTKHEGSYKGFGFIPVRSF